MAPIDIRKFWIKGVLLEAYPKFQEGNGADFDHDGSIQASESFGDLDGNGTVGNREDYQAYLSDHRAQLSAEVPFFRWGARLSVQNRIHQLMYLESDLSDPPKVEEGYAFISSLIEGVKTYVADKHLSAEEESLAYYKAMQSSGIDFHDSVNSSLLANIHDHELDCDTSSFVAMVIGDERALHLNPTSAPHHVFLRGVGEQGPFNVDLGRLTRDESYHVAPELILKGAYLQTLDDEHLSALFYSNRGLALSALGRYQEALDAYEQAFALNPNNPSANDNRGNVLQDLGRYEDALAAYDRSIEYDPSNASTHTNRGDSLIALGRHEDALAAYDRSVALDSNRANGHTGRGLALLVLGRNEEALTAYDRGLELNPSLAFAHNNRGNALLNLGRYEEALTDYDRALALDPNYAIARNNRDRLLQRLKRDK